MYLNAVDWTGDSRQPAAEAFAVRGDRIVAVGTTPGCEGGFPGIFDLAGNVHEWEDACYPISGPGDRADKCWFRGGSYHDLDNSCTSAWEVSRDYVDDLCDIGFRCCADP